ncbi:hypothetical protein EON83_29345 [bacterium]|nr:MAG: hypothetical protein EON83_29345 [bacterium]
MKAVPKNLLNICFVIAFWCVCLLLLPLGVNWERQGDEGRSIRQVRRSSKSPLFVNRALNREWEQSRLVQMKIDHFKERAPRQDLVVRLLPTRQSPRRVEHFSGR